MMGNSILYKTVISSGIPSQHKKGGQSQQRFLRKHQEAVKSYVRKIEKKIHGLKPLEYTGNKFLIEILK
jgi:peptide subunit release factor 1 (eRF1)